VAQLPLGPATRVLDAGCGDGRHVAAAAARGCFVVGLDSDLAVLRESRSRIEGADFVAADVAWLPFRDGAFDATICTETLEHLADDGAALCEIARTLRPGGALLGAVPSHFTELLYWRLSPGYAGAPRGHVRIYRPRALAVLLAQTGLGLTSTRYVHFIDSIVWLRFCMTDLFRPPNRAATAYEQAIMLAMAAERPVATWRRRLRAAMARSRFIRAIDTAGALIWPKSFMFVARKSARTATGTSVDEREPVAAGPHI
jgi:SAM-dependent methyltransferase